MSISGPMANFVGKTLSSAESVGYYNLPLQVKPYVSKDSFASFPVNLTHPQNGRLRNTFSKVKKGSIVHATGVLIYREEQVYREVLELQFLSVKSDNVVP